MKRKNPHLPRQKEKESKSDYAARKAAYEKEKNEWNGKVEVENWVLQKRKAYDELEDRAEPPHMWDKKTQLWYKNSSYSSYVAAEHAAAVVRQLKVLLETGVCDGSGQMRQRKACNEEQGVRDLIGHLDRLKLQLPSYESECSKIMRAREKEVDDSGLGEDLNSLFDSYCCVGDMEQALDRLTLFQRDDPPEFLKAKIRNS